MFDWCQLVLYTLLKVPKSYQKKILKRESPLKEKLAKENVKCQQNNPEGKLLKVRELVLETHPGKKENPEKQANKLLVHVLLPFAFLVAISLFFFFSVSFFFFSRCPIFFPLYPYQTSWSCFGQNAVAKSEGKSTKYDVVLVFL